MSTYEHNTLMQYKDQNGDMHLTYPVTKAENVDGLYGDAALTGVPTAPTASSGTNTTQIATTAFVHQELEEVKATIPEEPDLTAYAPLASPTLTGTPKAPTAAKGTNTTQIATTAYVQTEVADLKKSVSDGKTLVATAITDKGVDTAADATFAVMAANVRAIESGGGIGLNIFTQETEPETKDGVWIKTANLYESVEISSKTYQNTISEGIYDGWIEKSTLPYEFSNSCAVNYNGEIHILGNKTGSTNHYKFDGSTWTKVSTLPYAFCVGSAVVYNNEIHILGGGVGNNNTHSHYKFDGSSWAKVSSILPYIFNNGSAVVYNNEIHILGGTNGRTNHYKFNGSSWTKVSTLPRNFYNGSAVVYNNEIHILGGYNAKNKHNVFNGTSWASDKNLPGDYEYGDVYGDAAVVYDNAIHILGGKYSSTSTYDYKFDGSSWTKVSTLPYGFNNGSAVVYNNEIHILGGDYSTDTPTKHYATHTVPNNYSGTKIAIYQNPSNAAGVYATNFISGVPITGENNKFPSGFDDVYYIDDSGNVEESPTYYGDGTQWIKLKN